MESYYKFNIVYRKLMMHAEYDACALLAREVLSPVLSLPNSNKTYTPHNETFNRGCPFSV